MGKGGELNRRLDYLITNAAEVLGKGKREKERAGATVALTALSRPIALTKHGKYVEIKRDMTLTSLYK
jgi:hypothetical protein